jgi:hypothetical protein
MADTVRFYWRDQDAGISIKVPESDQDPLRVRRSVVQSSAPDLIRQLETGRFATAAWETGGSVFLILCHPNLAKGPDDSLLIDDSVPPRVRLTLDGWENVPETSKLFLRAFGSDATNDEERAAARRDLAEWLVQHRQPEAAAAVKRFSTFPFGINSDALEVLNTWSHLLVKGEKVVIDRFLDQVEKRFKALGWTRDSDLEGKMNRFAYQANRFYCWASAPFSGPRVRLCLNRTTERRIRGSTYDFDERGSVADLASAIQHALVDVLEPVAAAIGVKISYPYLGPISRVGNKTESAMVALAEAGDGRWPWPNSDELERKWRTFVLTAFRDDAALNPGELTAWFIASGWDASSATELTSRFYTDSALLGEYEEAGRQPA